MCALGLGMPCWACAVPDIVITLTCTSYLHLQTCCYEMLNAYRKSAAQRQDRVLQQTMQTWLVHTECTHAMPNCAFLPDSCSYSYCVQPLPSCSLHWTAGNASGPAMSVFPWTPMPFLSCAPEHPEAVCASQLVTAQPSIRRHTRRPSCQLLACKAPTFSAQICNGSLLFVICGAIL